MNRCPICGRQQHSAMMCSICAGKIGNELEYIQASLIDLPDMPFSNMQQRIVKVLDVLSSVREELNVYARRDSK